MSPCKTTTINHCNPASCLNRARLFSHLAANESRQPPIGIKRSACCGCLRPGGIVPPQKNFGTVPRPIDWTDSWLPSSTAPALAWLAVRAIRCKKQVARHDVQSGSWL
jgi:hypothetical protein